MATDIPGQEADLRLFLEAAGQSLADAQGTLGAEVGVSSGLIMANAELELKAAVKSDEKGSLAVQTISAQDIRQGGIDPGVLSTLRVSFVATAVDALQAPSPEDAPTRQPDDVIKDVRGLKDVAVLEKILGGLTYDAAYIPAKQRWLVTARDAKDRLVRELILPDRS